MFKRISLFILFFILLCSNISYAAYPTTTEHHKLYPYTSVMASPYSCDNTGSIDIAAAIEQIKANQSNVGTIYFPQGTYKLSTNLTIPVGMVLSWDANAKISITTGVTLTINGTLDAGLYQIFNCTGTGQVTFGTNSIGTVNPIWWGAVADGTTDCTAAFSAASKAAVAAHLNMTIPPTNSYYKTTGTIFWGNDSTTTKGSTLTAWGAKIVQASGTGPVLMVTKYDTVTGAFLTGNVSSRNTYANVQGGWWQQNTAGESVVVLRASSKCQSFFEKIIGADASMAGSYGLRVEGTYDDGTAYAYGGGYYNNIGIGQISNVYTGLSVKGSSNSNNFYGGSIQSVTRGIEVANDAGNLYRPDVLNFFGIAIESVAANGSGVYCDSQGQSINFWGIRLEIGEATVKAIDTNYSGTTCLFVGCQQSGASTLSIGASNNTVGCNFSSAAFTDPNANFNYRTKARRFYSLGDSATSADVPAAFYFKDHASQVDDAVRITDNAGNIKFQIKAGSNTATTTDPLSILNRVTLSDPRIQTQNNPLAYTTPLTPNIKKGIYISIAQLTGNITINLPSNLVSGDHFYIEVQADGTPRTIAWGAGISAAFTAVSASTLYVLEFRYNGTTAYQVGTPAGVTP